MFFLMDNSAQSVTPLLNNTTNTENLKPDSTISSPTDFDNSLDNLLRNWILQRVESSDCESEDIPSNTTDSIYKLRLSQMPCIMEMPFNSNVKSFIELYTVRKRRQMEYMLGMSDYYFPIFERILGANNLPLELKYLPIIESAITLFSMFVLFKIIEFLTIEFLISLPFCMLTCGPIIALSKITFSPIKQG